MTTALRVMFPPVKELASILTYVAPVKSSSFKVAPLYNNTTQRVDGACLYKGRPRPPGALLFT